MKNFDQFFKDKFEGRAFEFDQAHWEDAQRLIDADKKKRRRGGWLPWFLGVALLTVVSLGIYWMVGRPENASVDKTGDSITKVERGEMDGELNANTNASSNTNSNSNANTSSSSSANSNSNAGASASLDGNTGDSGDLGEKEKNGIEGREKKGGSGLTPDSAPIAATDLLENDKEKNKTDGVNTKNNGSTTTDENIATGLTVLKTTDQSVAPVSASEDPLFSESDENKQEEQIEEKLERILWTTFDQLPMKSYEIVWNGKSHKTIDCNFQPDNKFKRWNLGWTVTALLNTQKGEEYLWLGAATGPTLRYRLNLKWAIQTDVLYRWRRGHFSAKEESETTQYNFGLQTEKFRFDVQSIHQLDWPIYLQLKNRRQIIEGGLNVQFNLLQRADLISEKSLYPWERRGVGADGGAPDKTETTIVETSWINDPNIRSVQLGLLLGYRYKINQQLTIGLQARYDLNNIYKETPLDGIGQLDGSPLHIQVGVTCFPF